MRRRSSWLALLATVAALGAAPSSVRAGVVCDQPTTDPRLEYVIETVFGGIRLRLLDQPGEAPQTVANFRTYADRGDYDGSFFHRMVPDFVLQGGGYTYDPVDRYQVIPQDPPVVNEPGICNVRGTVAMAKLGGQPNSATTQFFINTVDNTDDLGAQNGGFTVFAVVHPDDMDVLDQITALHREYGPVFVNDPIRGALDNLPVLEILDRDPNGWGCVKSIDPDPIFAPQFGIWLPNLVDLCMDDEQLEAEAQALLFAAMDPQIPERLVMMQRVPEPGAALQLAAGAATLSALWMARRRRG
jgi:cyclophilin family peptidyl-prolyl cis-trans isomerase